MSTIHLFTQILGIFIFFLCYHFTVIGYVLKYAF